MSTDRHVKFPPLNPHPKQRPTSDHSKQNYSVQASKEMHEKLCWTGSSVIYARPGKKPQLLVQLEGYVNKELQAISPHDPKFQELKLQAYRNVFSCFISAFQTYQPLLSAIKKEYENTLALHQEQIQNLEPLQSRVQLMTEECDRKIKTLCGQEQAEIEALKREKQQLRKDIEAMKEREKTMQTVVEHLQSELSNLYLQYREERDARKLLIHQFNYLARGSATTERPVDRNMEDSKDTVELQLALKMCRKDLKKTQEELTGIKADYWDVVPRCNWETLEHNHERSLQQLKTLQGDFDQLKMEYNTLLESHKRSSGKTKTHVSTSVQTEECVSGEQSQIQSEKMEDHIKSDAPESSRLTVKEFREALKTPKSDEGTAESVAETETELDDSSIYNLVEHEAGSSVSLKSEI